MMDKTCLAAVTTQVGLAKTFQLSIQLIAGCCSLIGFCQLCTSAILSKGYMVTMYLPLWLSASSVQLGGDGMCSVYMDHVS